jgi:protein-S-isoprenylcysteine O-methyltransferase Ste14
VEKLALGVLIGSWLAFLYPALFRAPWGQARRSVIAAGPTMLGLLLESVGIGLAFAIREREPVGLVRMLAPMAIGPFAAWVMWHAVTHLGRQFRITAGLYEDHELVRTGPYAVVRHPIYAALLLLLLATLLLVTRLVWWLPALALYIAGTEIRVKAEDKLLGARFGGEFELYSRSVAAYIPFLR